MNTSIAATVLMNRVYRRQRHFYDLTRKHYLLGRDRLIAELNPGPTDNVLEIGCGTGRNLVLAGRRYPGARFFGLDVSTAMLTTAIEAIAVAKLASRIRVAHGDATRFDPCTLFGVARFERIFMSYSLSMIPAWPTVLDVALTRLAPRGELHIIDFGDMRELPRWFRSAMRLWLAQFHVTPCDTLETELAARAGAAGAILTFARPYRGYAQSAIFRT